MKKTEKYFTELYKFTIITFIVVGLGVIFINIGDKSSATAGIAQAFSDHLFKNVGISVAICIFVFAPLIFKTLFAIVTRLFPTTKERTPQRAQARVMSAQLMGIAIGLAIMTVILRLGNMPSAATIILVLASILWLFSISVIMFSFRTATRKSPK